ncbi:MAG: hypothetical protein NC336_04465 [Clostridium sp.]|nr:hypothetical protein [Clostridium sp.]
MKREYIDLYSKFRLVDEAGIDEEAVGAYLEGTLADDSVEAHSIEMISKVDPEFGSFLTDLASEPVVVYDDTDPSDQQWLPDLPDVDEFVAETSELQDVEFTFMEVDSGLSIKEDLIEPNINFCMSNPIDDDDTIDIIDIKTNPEEIVPLSDDDTFDPGDTFDPEIPEDFTEEFPDDPIL